MILENLKTAGVQQAHKEDKITFTRSRPGPATGLRRRPLHRGRRRGSEKRAAIFIGPEFGTVTRPDLGAAAREAGDAGFDVLIACAFNYDAHARIQQARSHPVLKARMNADLHMAERSQEHRQGQPVRHLRRAGHRHPPRGRGTIRVKVNGVDVFHPNTGEVRSDGADGIACWFIDTDYNEESFFVRHAYFLGPTILEALKTTLKAEINEEAWATLNSDTSRAFYQTQVGAHRRQGDQPPRRRGDEGVPGGVSAGTCRVRDDGETMSSRRGPAGLRFTKVDLENWRNFAYADVGLSQRVFIVGPNASGKSNLLDVFRFLHDIVIVGGGLEEATHARTLRGSRNCTR